MFENLNDRISMNPIVHKTINFSVNERRYLITLYYLAQLYPSGDKVHSCTRLSCTLNL